MTKRRPAGARKLLATVRLPKALTLSAFSTPQQCVLHQSTIETELDPEPAFAEVTAFAPATIANLGPGFDFLGCAVDGLGDSVTLKIDPETRSGRLVITSIHGDPTKKISLIPNFNCTGIAAIAAMKMLGICSCGLSLSLHKGLPLGSGLGSSAASAAAAALAVNHLLGNRLPVSDLVLAGLESEATVSGYHAANIAPALMGGFVLVQTYAPLPLISLPFPADKDLFFVGTPRFWGWRCLLTPLVEPRRKGLIPGMTEVMKGAVGAGAYGCTISRAGPTAVAVTDCEERGREIGQAMVEAFLKDGKLRASASVHRLDRVVAKVLSTS
ncbi:hypothetical protein AMTR_s00041p00069440 [Amborella trichopoda]|uniref:GHMP kinase N-terminal domain-containing protein n=1 Tax=Amborella trichopoda TaxID=13333 RepID=W1PYD2_AMBTC|nr:hypothetical protein AMTR_s00041p00069440 [Amborella trichopoda]